MKSTDNTPLSKHSERQTLRNIIANAGSDTHNGELGPIIERLDQRIRRINMQLGKAEEGSLGSFIKNGERYYLARGIEPNKSNNYRSSRYIHKNDTDTIMRMAQQDYCKVLLPTLSTMRDELLRFNVDPEELALSKLPEWEADLIRNGPGTRQDYIARWLAEPYEINPFKAENRTIETLRGDFVRSKGERDIADELFRFRVPYKPDAKLSTPSGDLYVDFLTLHPVTLKEMIWEHDGMMDNPEYIKTNYDRIARLAEAGFLLGENLIMTAETSTRHISSRTILKMIEIYYK